MAHLALTRSDRSYYGNNFEVRAILRGSPRSCQAKGLQVCNIAQIPRGGSATIPHVLGTPRFQSCDFKTEIPIETSIGNGFAR